MTNGRDTDINEYIRLYQCHVRLSCKYFNIFGSSVAAWVSFIALTLFVGRQERHKASGEIDNPDRFFFRSSVEDST